MAACLADAGSGCPSGLGCTANTPNPADPGLCLPACGKDSDCNSSSATAYTCSDGWCHCTRDSDCQAVPDAGFVCDVGSGSCYLPCGSKTDPDCLGGGYNWGCCSQVASLGYCDLMLPSIGWSGGGVIPDAGFCSVPTVDPSSLADGGCLTTQDAGCPTGFACAPTTPNPLDPGTCQPACASDADCNAAGSGTALTCSAGVCRCSTASDCPPDDACNPTSGACYVACGPTTAIGCSGTQGCCAQFAAANGPEGYCDPMISPAPAGFTVGPHSAWPSVSNPQSGPVLSALQLVTVTFNPWKDNGAEVSYPFQQAVEDYDAWLVGSTWLAKVGADYGVGLGANTNRRLSETPPTTVLDGPSTHAVATFINQRIASGALPAPTVNTLYAVYYPFTTTIYDSDDLAGSASCQTFDAYHDFGKYQSTSYAYAVIPTAGTAQPRVGTSPTTFRGPRAASPTR